MSDRANAGSAVTDRRAGAGAVLASDADRDAVAGQLSAALAEGRLTTGEHAERAGAVHAARTVEELGALTADLPSRAGHEAGRGRAAVDSEAGRCMLCALLILCPPAGMAWLLAARKHARVARPRAARVRGPGGTSAEDR